MWCSRQELLGLYRALPVNFYRVKTAFDLSRRACSGRSRLVTSAVVVMDSRNDAMPWQRPGLYRRTFRRNHAENAAAQPQGHPGFTEAHLSKSVRRRHFPSARAEPDTGSLLRPLGAIKP